MITHIILLGGVAAVAAPVVPTGKDGNFMSIVGILMTALTKYYESIYAVLCSSAA